MKKPGCGAIPTAAAVRSPRSVFLQSFVPYAKNRLKHLLETVIISTIIAVPLKLTFVHSTRTIIRSSLITGLVPGSSYSSHFGLPSKVHSAIRSIPQSHRLRLSVTSSESLLFFLNGFSSFCSIFYAGSSGLSTAFFTKIPAYFVRSATA